MTILALIENFLEMEISYPAKPERIQAIQAKCNSIVFHAKDKALYNKEIKRSCDKFISLSLKRYLAPFYLANNLDKNYPPLER